MNEGKYGVFFCNSHTLSEMRKLGLQVEVVDLGSVSASGMVTIDQLYLQVLYCQLKLPVCCTNLVMQLISLFKGFVCFVYVQGMESVPDLFLKWCCEV